MKKKEEMTIKRAVKWVYLVVKCSISIRNLLLEMVIISVFICPVDFKFTTIVINFRYIYSFGSGIDEGDEAISSYVREEDEEEDKIEYRELDMERLAFEASETDTTGITVASIDRLKANGTAEDNKDNTGNVLYKLTIYKYDNGASIILPFSFQIVTVGEGATALAINENLFMEEDLEDLEEELGDLDLEE